MTWGEFEKYLSEDYKVRMDKIASLQESIKNHKDQLECCKNVSADLLNKFPQNTKEKLVAKIQSVITSKVDEIRYLLEKDVEQLKGLCDMKLDLTSLSYDDDDEVNRFNQVKTIFADQRVKLQCLLQNPDFYSKLDEADIIPIPVLHIYKLKQLMMIM